MLNKQTQEAGDNSQQLQATTMIVNYGIDEKRAREIYKEMNLQLRKDYSQEALNIANSRVTEFENRLLPKMEAVEGALGAFADPSFQLLLVEAQKTAAATERPADYDLLSELLIHRFQKGNNRIIRAGVSRAVEIVDEISDDSLLGLTIFYTVTNILPATGDIQQGLESLNNLFGKLLYCNLPIGSEWIDHLDILDAIRVNILGKLSTMEEYYSKYLDEYINIGIKKNSDNHKNAINILKNNELPQNILVDHALNPEYIRLNIFNKEQISSLTLLKKENHNGRLSTRSIPLSETQINAVKSIYDLYKTDNDVRQQNVKTFMDEWDKRPNLKQLREWWDSIGVGLNLTSVGTVLAHSNAQRCEKNIPPLD